MVKSSTLYVENSFFQYIQAYQVAILLAQDSSVVNITGSTIISNWAQQDTVFRVTAYSDLFISGSIIEVRLLSRVTFYQLNEAYLQNSVGQYIQSDNSTISNSVVRNNYISKYGTSNTF